MSSSHWFSEHPIDVAFDDQAPITVISRAAFAQDMNNAIAQVDDQGRDTITGPLMISTRRGVYVTVLPVVVVEVADVRGVILGQDWLSVTSARVESGTVIDWDTSWTEGNCAWFSCAYYPDMDNPPPAELWRWTCWAINRMHNTMLECRNRAWYNCGPASQVFAIGRPEGRTVHLASPLSSVPKQQRATAADIPQDLFNTIIQYTHTCENGCYIINDTPQHERRPSQLSKCALVCLHWAKVSRRLMYDSPENTVTIRSLSELRGLADSSRRGSNPLTPVDKLLRQLRARQGWESYSWIHHLYSSPFDCAGNQLHLWGPVPEGFPTSALRSPHWSLPKTLPSCFLNFCRVQLTHIHFPALFDFAKLIKHFVRTETFSFSMVTWGITDVVVPSRASSHSKPRNIVAGGCTDDYMLHAQTRLILDKPNIPYYHLPMQEQDACLEVLSALAGCTDRSRREKEIWLLSHLHWPFPSPLIDFRWRACEGITLNISFLYDWAPGAPVIKAIRFSPWPDSNTSLDGLAKYYAILHAELQARRFSSLAVISLEFSAFSELQHTLNAFPELRRSPSGDVAYRLLCKRDGLKEHSQFLQALQRARPGDRKWDWAGVDPDSMQPTGETWSYHIYKHIIKELDLQSKPE